MENLTYIFNLSIASWIPEMKTIFKNGRSKKTKMGNTLMIYSVGNLLKSYLQNCDVFRYYNNKFIVKKIKQENQNLIPKLNNTYHLYFWKKTIIIYITSLHYLSSW